MTTSPTSPNAPRLPDDPTPQTGHVLEFFVAGVPRPKGNSKRVVRAGRFHRIAPRKKDQDNEDLIAARVMSFRPPRPLDGPLRLDVVFHMPVPKGLSKWKKAAAARGLFFPVPRPDRGNLLKLIEDALEGPFYEDDAAIVGGEVAKVYADERGPGYTIRLEQLPTVTSAAEWRRLLKFEAEVQLQELCEGDDAEGTAS